MQLISVFYLFSAEADYNNLAPASVVRFTIYLALFVSIIGWVLGVGLIKQTKVQAKVKAKLQASKIKEYDFESHNG